MDTIYMVLLIIGSVILNLGKEIREFDIIFVAIISLIILTFWGFAMKYIGLWNLNIYIADLVWILPLYLIKLLDLRKNNIKEDN